MGLGAVVFFVCVVFAHTGRRVETLRWENAAPLGLGGVLNILLGSNYSTTGTRLACINCLILSK